MQKDTTLEVKALAIVGEVKTRLPVVSNQADLDRANVARKHCSALKAEIEAVFNPIVTKAHAAHREAIAQRKQMLQPVDDAITWLRRVMGEYMEVQQRKRQAEEAEALRQQQEAQRKADAAAAEAAAAEAQGQVRQADDRMQQALRHDQEATDIAKAQPATPRPVAQGVHTRTAWDFEVEDISKLPREFMAPDMQLIRAHVKVKKGAAAIPGVRVFSKTVFVGRN